MNRLFSIDLQLSRLHGLLFRGLPGVLFATLLWPHLGASQTQPNLTWQGEVRPRLYAKEPVSQEWDHWISMRTRIGLDGRFQDGIGFFIQIQDVRYWGEETSIGDHSADLLDVHQAYLEVEDLPAVGGLVRVGRQEVGLAEGRLIAAPNWGQAGKSFDGVRFMKPVGRGHLDLVYLRLKEGSAETHDESADLMAAWLALPLDGVGAIDFLAVHDRKGGIFERNVSTLGAVLKAESGPLSARIQGLYQVGENYILDVSAYMIATQATLTLADGKGNITLWYDHLSGDKAAGDLEENSFDNLFGARHRYYGRADYFRDVPFDTRWVGLRDASLKFGLRPTPEFQLNMDIHRFWTAVDRQVSNQHLGDEVDIWAKYTFREAMDLEAGYSLVLGGTAMEELEILEGTGHNLYFMTSVHF